MQIRVFDEESSNGCVLHLEPLILLLDNGSILNGMISRQDSMPEDDFVFFKALLQFSLCFATFLGNRMKGPLRDKS